MDMGCQHATTIRTHAHARHVVSNSHPDELSRDRCDVSVLVVDDDSEIREMMATILADAGYSVETAADGQEALAVLRSIRPGVIFLDLQMPRMNGAEFRQSQRRNRNLISIPTVVMTASNDEPVLDLAVEETLRKPVRLHDLLRIVQRHCPSDRH
jgi:CheY-like chemotaxis protein